MAITDARLSIIMKEREGTEGATVDIEVSHLDGEEITYSQLAFVAMQLASQFLNQALGNAPEQ